MFNNASDPRKTSIEKTIRRKSDYVHLIFASVNFLVMVVTSLDFLTTLALSIALTGISLMLYVTFIYYWKTGNQFFIIFNYGSTICALIIFADAILWSLMFMFVSFIQILSIFIIIYFIYLLTLVKNLGQISISRKTFIARYGFQGHKPQKVEQMWQDDSVDTFKPMAQIITFEEQAEVKNKEKKLYDVRKISLLTLILTSCFLIIYTFALMN